MAKIGLVEQAIEKWFLGCFSRTQEIFWQKMPIKRGFSVHDFTTDGVTTQKSDQANFQKMMQKWL
ncbi:MAG: hypothetical protein WBE86_15485 [Candidatus Acidiferrales bacterium]